MQNLGSSLVFLRCLWFGNVGFWNLLLALIDMIRFEFSRNLFVCLYRLRFEFHYVLGLGLSIVRYWVVHDLVDVFMTGLSIFSFWKINHLVGVLRRSFEWFNFLHSLSAFRLDMSSLMLMRHLIFNRNTLLLSRNTLLSNSRFPRLALKFILNRTLLQRGINLRDSLQDWTLPFLLRLMIRFLNRSRGACKFKRMRQALRTWASASPSKPHPFRDSFANYLSRPSVFA